jgi:hypothetical protein
MFTSCECQICSLADNKKTERDTMILKGLWIKTYLDMFFNTCSNLTVKENDYV